MNLQRFVLQLRPMHLYGSLAMGEHIPAPDAQTVTIRSDKSVKRLLAQGEDHPTDTAPEYGSAAHGARLHAGVKGAASQVLGRKIVGRQAHQVGHGVRGAIRTGDHRVLGFEQHLAVWAGEHGTEGSVATLARGAGERDGRPEMSAVRIVHLLHPAPKNFPTIAFFRAIGGPSS
jgi:hypothetical protein